MGNSEDRRRELRERLRLWREWLTSFGEGSDKKAKLFFLAAFALALLIWGLQLIGVTVNLWLGGVALCIAFVMAVCAFWIWEGLSRFHVVLRVATAALAGVLYFSLIGKQMIAEWKREHVVPPTLAYINPAWIYR